MSLVRCPNCGKETEYEGNELRPFCSLRCKMLDFGAWADEKYALPVGDASLSDEDLRQLEDELEKGAKE